MAFRHTNTPVLVDATFELALEESAGMMAGGLAGLASNLTGRAVNLAGRKISSAAADQMYGAARRVPIPATRAPISVARSAPKDAPDLGFAFNKSPPAGARQVDGVRITGPGAPGGDLLSRSPVTKGSKPIVIGENMKRVQQYADEIGGHAYRPWKNEPFNFDLAMRRNQRWIRDQMRQGRRIIDIGPDFRRRAATGRRSPFYEMERRSLREKGYKNYQKVFERNGSRGGVPGLDY